MKFILPLEVFTTKSQTPKSKFILNLNNYRNAHFLKLNAAKIAFKKEVEDQILAAQKQEKSAKFRLIYTLFPKSNRRIDTNNPLTIIDKFFCDALTEFGFWEDDDSKHLIETIFRPSEVSPENPRAECEVIVEK
jgi:hypothetical protein